MYTIKLSKSGKKHVKLAAVYATERLVFTRNFSEPQNPRFIIKSGFNSRAGYNGARTVVKSGLGKIILKFHEPLQRYLLTCQANSAILGRFFGTGQQQL